MWLYRVPKDREQSARVCVSQPLIDQTADELHVKYGPEGAVAPGQMLDYRVEYENEGEGIAFGVYFTDRLDDDLDESRLVIGPVHSTVDHSIIAGPGVYSAGTRTIT